MKSTGKRGMKMRSMTPSESDEQRGFLDWFEARWPHVRIFHIPNGGFRTIKAAKAMKRDGVRPGVPDLYVPEWRLWVEMKRAKGGRVSPEQKDWIVYLRGIGDTVIIGRGAADASRQVLEWRLAQGRE